MSKRGIFAAKIIGISIGLLVLSTGFLSAEEPTQKDPIKEEATVKEEYPNFVSIDLPFYSQAPFANWDYPWQEACEEASIALVANFYLEKNWTREEFNDELLALVDWEMGQFGAYEHTTLAQTVEMITENYGLSSQIIENPNFEDLMKSIHAGNLIVAPFAGKMLENPNFNNGGPIYHMLVIKGYEASTQTVITHDVGTRKGEDYEYHWPVLSEALHDWHDTDISLGTPAWIEISPPTDDSSNE